MAPKKAGLISDPHIRRDLGITKMTTHRWDRDQRMAMLGWPPAIYIRRRKYRNAAFYEDFKSRLAREAIARREALLEQQQQKESAVA